MILVLTPNGLMKVQFFTDGQGVEDDLRIPVAGCPIEGMSLFNDFMEASADFFKRSIVVVHMSIENVNIVQLESDQ